MILFALKKIIGVLLTPLNITLILLLLAILLVNYDKKLSKLFLISGFLVLFVSSTPFFSNPLIKSIEQSHSVFTQQAEPLDYIVVLGCGHVLNQKLPVIAQLKVCSLQRLMEAHRIFQLHPEAKLITSGYISNTNAVKQAAISIGVPSESILTENRPKDTKEEALFLSTLLKGKTFALVTNADHMERAYSYFRDQNLSPVAAPAGFMYKAEPQSILGHSPKVSVLQQTTRALYEILGQIAQRF
jgi:uncharacterized SAM-binding protein YcdF (DUF218 family)